MPTVTFLNKKKHKRVQSNFSMKRLINYVSQESKTTRELMGGVHCTPETAYEDFLLTKQAFAKETGRLFTHFEMSFSNKDLITPEQVKEIAEKLLEHKAFQGFQILYAVHTDTDNLHCHFVLNTVNALDGAKWQSPPALKYELIKLANKLSEPYGCVIPQKVKRNEYEKNKQAVHPKAEKENRSWKKELQLVVKETLKNSISEKDFLSNLKKMGYKATFREKDILFQTPRGFKCRSNKLTEYYSMDNIKKILLLNEQYANQKSFKENIENILKITDFKKPILSIPKEISMQASLKNIIQKEYQYLQETFQQTNEKQESRVFELYVLTQVAIKHAKTIEECLENIQSTGIDCQIKGGEIVYNLNDFDLSMDTAGLDRKTIELLLANNELRDIEKKEQEKILQQGKQAQPSWKSHIYLSVKLAKAESISQEDFVKHLLEQGINVTWTDQRKYITFENKNGKKMRNKMLYPNEFYTKEALEKAFEKNQKKIEKKETRIKEREEYKKLFKQIMRIGLTSTSAEDFSTKLSEHGFTETDKDIKMGEKTFNKDFLMKDLSLEKVFEQNNNRVKMDFMSNLFQLLFHNQNQTQEKYPLSKELEGDTYKDFIAEMKKGKGMDFGGSSYER